ncbi:MAG: VWA domain-containing protein [Candidatus Doudnabacteria bacterium]|nr:VWA domain-containing protein [Candidatus Doudnabacteria bacterium]
MGIRATKKSGQSATVFGLSAAAIIAALWLNFIPQPIQAAGAALAPSGIGNYDQWQANTGNKISAVASNDGDSSFITSSSTSAAETYSFPGAGLPAGATVNSITLTAQVKNGGSIFVWPAVQLLLENGANSANDGAAGHIVIDNSAYTPISWTMADNPLTSAPWTLSDVNAWTVNFGVGVAAASAGTAMVTQISLSVDYNPPPAANPPLPARTCGLDIALVLDNSGSINGSLPQMKSAVNNFISSLLPGTPTDFSVTYFNTAGHVQQVFTNSTTSLASAINNIPASGGDTNWEDGLLKAAGTFDPRPGSLHPNLIIFASDGVPNKYNVYGSGGSVTGTQGNGSNGGDPLALSAAVTEANAIKTSGTRIVTLGIGSSINQANMVAISSSDAYNSVSDFSHLAPVLQSLAAGMCGGTITINKKIDADGNLATTNDQTNGGAGFTFDITPGYGGQITDANGQTPAVAVTAGSYSVAESSIPGGYAPLGGSCSGATNNGSPSGTAVSGLQIGLNDIVACIFYNSPIGGGGGGPGTTTPTSTDISILKSVDKPAVNAGNKVNFTLAVTNYGPANATGVMASDTLPSGLVFVSSTSTLGSYNATTSLWNIGNLAVGAWVTTTITAAVTASSSGQSLTNTAAVSSVTPDFNPANNSSSISVSVGGGGGGGCTSNCGGGTSTLQSDLSITKTVDHSSPNPNDAINYILVVKNLGPDGATGVVATDTLPSTVTFVSSTSTLGSFDSTTSLWTIGNLANGASATTTITASVNSSAAGQSIANTASVTSAIQDPNLSNNSSSAGGTVAGSGSGGGTTNGGCSGSCGGGSPSGGGGGGGGGGAPGAGLTFGGGQVLSTSTGLSMILPATAPQVLGASTLLPRTGEPVTELGLLFLLSIAGGQILLKRRKI